LLIKGGIVPEQLLTSNFFGYFSQIYENRLTIWNLPFIFWENIPNKLPELPFSFHRSLVTEKITPAGQPLGLWPCFLVFYPFSF